MSDVNTNLIMQWLGRSTFVCVPFMFLPVLAACNDGGRKYLDQKSGVRKHLDQLDSLNQSQRQAAITKLIRFEDSCIPLVLSRLQSGRMTMRGEHAAVAVLERIGTIRSTEALIEFLDSYTRKADGYRSKLAEDTVRAIEEVTNIKSTMLDTWAGNVYVAREELENDIEVWRRSVADQKK